MKKVNIIQVQKPKINKNNCNILLVPKEVCYIKFGKSRDKVSYSIDNINKKTEGIFTPLEMRWLS